MGMASTQTYEEAGDEYRQKMGDELGSIFHRLWNQCVLLHMRWDDYADMFGTGPDDFTLLNEVAPGFFKSVQDTSWEWILLKLCHFSDGAVVAHRRTLSLDTLLKTKGGETVPNLKNLVEIARQSTKFAKDWRDRHIAHADLEYELEKNLKPLAAASRAQVRVSLQEIDAVLRAVSMHFMDTDLSFDDAGHKWGRSLLYELRAFSTLKKERKARMNSGIPREGDLEYRKWMGLE
jgi:hypothetical protein